VLLAELLSGRRLDVTGGLVPLESDQVRGIWEGLCSSYRPEDRSSQPQQVLFWHRKQVEDDRDQSAVWHLDRLITVDAGWWPLYAERAKALQSLGQWGAAITDY